jgi:hypothetical protein
MSRLRVCDSWRAHRRDWRPLWRINTKVAFVLSVFGAIVAQVDLPKPEANSRMHLRLAPPIALLAVLALAPFVARAALGETVSAEDAAVRVKGDAKALELDVHQARLADVLTALARFNIRYRSPVVLNKVIDGTYGGPLGHVLSRLLAGYNYAIKQDDAEIDVIIVSRYGEQAIPAPIIVQRRGSGE